MSHVQQNNWRYSPAMSNILRRLRNLFNDPLLIRSSEGMTPTERALNYNPVFVMPFLIFP
jgi:hypothetical protein